MPLPRAERDGRQRSGRDRTRRRHLLTKGRRRSADRASTAGDTCANAITLPGAGTYTYDSTGLAGDYDDYLGDCSSVGKTAAGVEMIFAIDVGAGQVLNVTVTPSVNEDPVLLLASSCGDPVSACVDYADSGLTGDPETLSYTNTTGSTQTMFLIADNYDAGSAGPFKPDVALHTPMCGDGAVDAGEACDDGNTTDGDGCTACAVDTGYHCTGAPSTCTPAPAGDTCGSAIPITVSGSFTGSFDGLTNDYDPTDNGCTAYHEPGPDIVYAVTLTAGQSMSAKLTPGNTQDVAIYTVTSCGDVAAACVDGADSGLGGDPETTTYAATADTTVYVIVDTYSASTTGPYALDITIQ